MRVLLIEDNPEDTELQTVLLRRRGLSVLTAASGEEGIELARHNSPDVILCDLRLLGTGIDGYGVAQTLRGDPAFNAVPLIALSGYGERIKESEEKALAAGFDAFLEKPLDPKLLAQALSGLILHRMATRRELAALGNRFQGDLKILEDKVDGVAASQQDVVAAHTGILSTLEAHRVELKRLGDADYNVLGMVSSALSSFGGVLERNSKQLHNLGTLIAVMFAAGMVLVLAVLYVLGTK